MKVKSVRYARLRNLGNYENERAEAEVELDDGDTVKEGFARAKAVVLKQLGIRERVRIVKEIVEDDEWDHDEVKADE